MIKLKRDNLLKLEQYYTNSMLNDIKQRYDRNKSGSVANNPFTGLPYITIFEDSYGRFDEDLIKALLCKSIIGEKSSFKQINSYIMTGKLVFHSNFFVDEVLKNSGLPIKKIFREKIRIDYVDKYSNDWLNSFKLRFPNYYKTSKDFKQFIRCIEKKLIILNKEISNIVDYNYLTSEMRHYIICNMGVDVCPYCNRQYITSYIEDGKKKTTADLDHFLPKSLFTFLSLSLFNFIPSCQICNSRFKSDRRIEILYPYEEGFGEDARFLVEINSKSNFESLIGNNDFFNLKVDVKNNCNKESQIYSNIKMFRINGVYQIHKQHVRELIYKKTAYKNTYKKMLSELMKSMNLSNDEIDLFLYGYSLNQDEFYRKPLAKLTHDIIKDIK